MTRRDQQQPQRSGPVSNQTPGPSAAQPGPARGLPRAAGTWGNRRLQRALKAQASQCPQIQNVDARVDGTKKWTRVRDGVATFEFTGQARADGCKALRYEWDFGNGKTATVPNVAHSYEDAGQYRATLTVSCEGCPDVVPLVDTVDVVVLDISSFATTSRPPLFQERRELGPGENVAVFVQPRPPEVTARVEGGGSIRRIPGGFHFTAPAVAARSRVLVESPTMDPYVVTFLTFPPTRITQQKVAELSVESLQSYAAGTGMSMRATLHAIDEQDIEHDVFFGNIEVISKEAEPEEIAGFFEFPARHWNYKCAGMSSWSDVDGQGALAETERIIFGGDEPDLAPPPAWQHGSFVCERPWRYRVKGDLHEHDISSTVRSYEMDGPGGRHDVGTVSIDEDGAHTARAPDDFRYP